MEKLWIIVVSGLLAGLGLLRTARAQDEPFFLEGIHSQQVAVSSSKMTNLVFTVPVATAVKVSREVLAQKVPGISNVIELKAVRKNFQPTNLSVFGDDGRLYSFDLHYVDDTSVLSYLVVPAAFPLGDHGRFATGDLHHHPILFSGLPVNRETLAADADSLGKSGGFLREGVRSERMHLELRGVYLKDSLQWMAFHLANHSLIPYRVAFVRMYIEDLKKVKRTATQRVGLNPMYESRLWVVSGNGGAPFVLAFAPFAVPKRKKVVIEITDQGGGRTLVLPVKAKTLLKTRVAK